MGWYEAIKDAATVADKLRDAEMKQKLADVQVECAKLAEDNAQLRQEVIELREKVQTRQKMEFRYDVYWSRLPEGEHEGPYCPKCLDGDGKASRMGNRQDDRFWRCRVCGTNIEKQGVR